MNEMMILKHNLCKKIQKKITFENKNLIMRNLLFILLLIKSSLVAAQINFVERLEFDIKEEEFNNHSVHIYGKDGFLIRSSTAIEKGIQQFKYELYSTDLKPIKNHIEKIELSKTTSSRSYHSKTHLIDVFYNKNGTTQVVSIEGSTLKQSSSSITLPPNIYFSEGKVSGNNIYLYGRIKKNPIFVVIDWKTSKNTIVPITINNYKSTAIWLENISVLEKSNEAFLTFNAKKGKITEVFVLKLDKNNEVQDQINLSASIEKNLTGLSAIYVKDKKYILTGTYSTKGSSTSEGIYFAEMEGNKINYIKYKSFIDLKNFLSYLPQKQQDKIEKKKKKKEASGKELTIKYNIANHDLILGTDCYYYIGEAYYATYRTETYTTYVNGRPVTQTRQVFDGYQYTHATLLKYSLKGEIIWDETFAMWPSYKPFSVKKFIKVNENVEKSVDLIFASRNRIVSKSFDINGNILYERTSDEIATQIIGDQTKYSFSNIENWYDNYFLAFGTQRIKNKENDDVKKKRTVFFINKIKY
jgi:hypothetical protein